MAYGLIWSLLPRPWFEFWPGYIRHFSVPVSPPPPPSFKRHRDLLFLFTFPRISTQILSHFVEDFTLVSTFFLFAVGCLNILLGLIFRESAKAKRSICSSRWRARVRNVLPNFQWTPAVSVSNNFISRVISSPTEILVTPYMGYWQEGSDATVPDNVSWKSTEKVQYGFGTQGEKSAALRGYVVQKPVESLPRYTASSPAVSPPTTFRSRPNAS